MGKKAAAARKDIYAFIKDTLGVTMTIEQKDEIKALVVANATAQKEDYLGKITELEDALRKRPVKRKKVFIKLKYPVL